MNECCNDLANREVLWVSEKQKVVHNGQDYYSVSKKEQCTKCGRKHYRMDAEPVELESEAMKE